MYICLLCFLSGGDPLRMRPNLTGSEKGERRRGSKPYCVFVIVLPLQTVKDWPNLP